MLEGNRFDWDGIISITSSLKTTKNSLQDLNIDDPSYKSNDRHFFNHFGKMFLSNSGLRKLSLKYDRIRFEALNIIIHCLVNNKSLVVLI